MREYCLILTEDEEQTTVTYVSNKNRALQGINHSVLMKLVIDVLKIRSGKYVALSKNA